MKRLFRNVFFSVLEAYLRDGSDREAVIIGSTHVDELLQAILLKYFVPPRKPKEENLLDNGGPLGSFYARINVCYRLGLYNEGFHDVLNGIREVRNKFAHDIIGKSLSDSDILDKTAFLLNKCDQRSVHWLKDPISRGSNSQSSQDFRILIAHAIVTLQHLLLNDRSAKN